MSERDERCPFCAPDGARIFHAGDLVLGIWDAVPVSPGHALLLPKRHVPSWFDASSEERRELTETIALARERIERTHSPDGFNVGINIGEAAGQTVPHLHVHVIPRYANDVADPRGGVRHVIPAKGNYLAEPLAGEYEEPHGSETHAHARVRRRPRSAPVISTRPVEAPRHPHEHG